MAPANPQKEDPVSMVAEAQPTTTPETAPPPKVVVAPKTKHPRNASIGRLAVDSAGRIGMIQTWKRGYKCGICVFTGDPWSAKHPRLIGEEDTARLLSMTRGAERGAALERKMATVRSKSGPLAKIARKVLGLRAAA